MTGSLGNAWDPKATNSQKNRPEWCVASRVFVTIILFICPMCKNTRVCIVQTIFQTLHVCHIYAYIDPPNHPQLIGKYGIHMPTWSVWVYSKFPSSHRLQGALRTCMFSLFGRVHFCAGWCEGSGLQAQGVLGQKMHMKIEDSTQRFGVLSGDR